MRHVATGLGLAVMVVVTGCNHWPHTRERNPVRVGTGPAPKAADLVKYLNDNAGRVQAIEGRRLAIDCKQNGQPAGLEAVLVCRKPRDFRLMGTVAGSTEVDIGSNSQEFWYWIKRADPPYVFYCSYEDFQRGAARNMPFPFQPDWIIAALGVAEYDPAKPYELTETRSTLELSETAASPSGQPVKKVTIFSRNSLAGGRPQVVGYAVRDARGNDVCRATIDAVQVDKKTRSVLPERVVFTWPEQKLEMKMRLTGVESTTIDEQRAATVFSRQSLGNLQSYNLSRGPDSPPGQAVQRAGATAQPR